MYKCSRCGTCCRNLNKSDLYKSIDRGDGVCKYLNGNLCSIYEKRPMLCRIDESYIFYFKDMITIEEYYKLNYKSCNKLRKQ